MMESVTGSTGSPALERKKAKKRKNKPNRPITNGYEPRVSNEKSNDKSDSLGTGKPLDDTQQPNLNHLPLSVNGNNDTKAKDQKTPKKKKKKNKGDGEGDKEGEVEDAAESIDSGCIADCPSEMVGDITDWPQVETVLLEENKFISSFLSWLPAPKGENPPGEEEEEDEMAKYDKEDAMAGVRAKLREELAECKKKRKVIPYNKILKRQETRLAKKMKALQMRKYKKLKRNVPMKSSRKGQQEEPRNVRKHNHKILRGLRLRGQKPIYNEKGELVFSKFDFSRQPGEETEKSKKCNDLKQILYKALKEKEKAKKLQEKGHTDEATKLVETRAWSNALQKAEGIKVKDNIDLLKGSIKRRESSKKLSSKRWEERKGNIEKKKAEKEASRKKNITARKDTKIAKKMKRMKKKGHMVPGF